MLIPWTFEQDKTGETKHLFSKGWKFTAEASLHSVPLSFDCSWLWGSIYTTTLLELQTFSRLSSFSGKHLDPKGQDTSHPFLPLWVTLEGMPRSLIPPRSRTQALRDLSAALMSSVPLSLYSNIRMLTVSY